MILDLSDVVLEYSQPIELITTERTTVDFEDTVIELSSIIQATVQPANKEKLKPEIVDHSLQYLMIHSDSAMSLGQYIKHKSTSFKIIEINDCQDYGYFEAIAEETKGAIN